FCIFITPEQGDPSKGAFPRRWFCLYTLGRREISVAAGEVRPFVITRPTRFARHADASSLLSSTVPGARQSCGAGVQGRGIQARSSLIRLTRDLRSPEHPGLPSCRR